MKSAFSRVSIADIPSKPVTLDVFTLFISKKDFVYIGCIEMKSCIHACEISWLVSAIRGNLTGKFWTNNGKVVIKPL